MAIRLKRKNSSGYSWQTSDLVEGQVGLNIADGTLHFKKTDNSVVKLEPKTLVKTESYASSMSINVAGYDIVRITLTGNISSLDFTGAIDGQKIILELIQDGTGGKTVAFGSSFRFGTDITSVTLTSTAGKKDRIGLIYDGVASKYDIIAVTKGY